MGFIFDQIRIWIEDTILSLGYVGIAFIMFVENLFPPIPSEVVMPFSGFLVADGELSFWGVLIAGTLGAGAGTLVIYGIGLYAGEERVNNWLRKYGRYLLVSEEDLQKSLDAFERHGNLYILFGRLVPGARSLISLPAGLREMDIVQFLFYTVIGTIIWNVLLILAGVFLEDNWNQVIRLLDAYQYIILASVIVLGIYFVYRRLKSQKKR